MSPDSVSGSVDRAGEEVRILVDSSVWIDYFRPDGGAGLREEVRAALLSDAVVTTPLVVTEVVAGAPDPDALTALLDDFGALRTLDTGFEVGARAARIGFSLRRSGGAVPSTDLLIAAAAIGADCELWHQDRHFSRIAEVAPLQERWLGG